MKAKLKYLLLSIICLITFVLASCSDDNDEYIHDTDISYSDLPKAAQEFVDEYFSYTVISQIILVYDDGMDIYEVNFEDGCQVDFNDEGVWQEVVAPGGKTIPDGIAPQTIVDYLNEYYADFGINEINKTGYGYNVELTTGLDLMFDHSGNFIDYYN